MAYPARFLRSLVSDVRLLSITSIARLQRTVQTSSTPTDIERPSNVAGTEIPASTLSVDKPLIQHSKGCPICSRSITFTHKDVLFLAQFLSPRGRLLSRKRTGVCKNQQYLLKEAIARSRQLGLLPRITLDLAKEKTS